MTAISSDTRRNYTKVIASIVLCLLTVCTPLPVDVLNEGVSTEESLSDRYRKYHINIIKNEILEKSTDLDDDESHEVASAIVEESMIAGYDPLFVIAIIEAESNFVVEATSRSGARGLMQIMPSTFRAVSSAKRMFDPVENVRAGIRYLGMLNGFKSINTVLLAYNQGPGGARTSIRDGDMPKETKKYIPNVINNYKSALERHNRDARLAHKSYRISPEQYASILQTAN